MKNLVSLFLVLLCFGFVGCSSDSNSNNNGQNELFLKFTVNGQQYHLEPTTITSLQKLIFGEREVNTVYSRLSLWMPVNPSLGSHAITDAIPTDSNLSTLHNADFWFGDVTYVATSGTLIITEINNVYIKGTFSFTAEDENGVVAVVTDGSFSAYK